MSMSVYYAVGWYDTIEDHLNDLFLSERETKKIEILTYSNEKLCFFPTPEQAKELLESIKRVNNEDKLRLLSPLGGNGLFVVRIEKVKGDPYTDYFRNTYQRYHLIMTPMV